MIADDQDHARKSTVVFFEIGVQPGKEVHEEKKLSRDHRLETADPLHDRIRSECRDATQDRLAADEDQGRTEDEQHGAHSYFRRTMAIVAARARMKQGSVPQHPPRTSTPASRSAGA